MTIIFPLMFILPMKGEAPQWMKKAELFSGEGPVSKRLYRVNTVPTLICGVGRKKAEKSLVSALEILHPEKVVIAGWAGAVDSALNIFDTVCVTEIVSEDGSLRFAFDKSLINRVQSILSDNEFRVFEGRGVTVDSMVDKQERKQRLQQAHQPSIVEMEGVGLMSVLHREGIPAVMVRVVTDKADESIGVDIESLPYRRKDQFFWGFQHPIQGFCFLKLLWNLKQASMRIDRMLPVLAEALAKK